MKVREKSVDGKTFVHVSFLYFALFVRKFLFTIYSSFFKVYNILILNFHYLLFQFPKVCRPSCIIMMLYYGYIFSGIKWF